MEKKESIAPVLWLTGLSGAGKTTLAQLLVPLLKDHFKQVYLLDGDEVRDFFENDLGYTRQERILNVKRIAFAAKCLADHGVCVVVANMAPYYEVRDFIRRKLSSYIQIYVKASLEVVMERDVKGLYRQWKEGKATHMVGIEESYDVPRNPHLTIDTDKVTPEEGVQQILGHVLKPLKEKLTDETSRSASFT